MKLLYFTGTGNSYDVASRLDGELIDIAKYRETVVEDDAVGIFCPVYCGDLPKAVWDFLDRVEIRSEYIFAAVTAGGSEGNALSSLQYRLNKKGAKLSYGICILMPDNVILFPTEKEKQKKELALLPDLAERLKKAVEARKTNEIRARRSPSMFTKTQWFFLKNGYGIKEKSANPYICTRCKKCESCPVGNIHVTRDGVNFDNKCVDCFRCIQICPVNAIAFGKVKRTEKTRYFNQNFLKNGWNQ